jgi:cytochrome c-type biogenesis protein CcmH
MSAWMIVAIMCCFALMPLMLALGARASDRQMSAASADEAHYRAQLDEIERLQASGAIGGKEADGARIEAARRLISTPAKGASGLHPDIQRRVRVVLSLMFLVLLPAVTAGLYARLGQPTLPDVPLAERRADDPDLFRALDMLTGLQARLGVNPDDGEAHDTIAPILMQMARYGEAARSYKAAARILGESPARVSGQAEAIVSSENGQVTPEARALFARALELDPANGAARFYGGMALKQDGRTAEAAAIWQSLWTDTPDPNLRRIIADQLKEIGAAPPGAPAQP